MQNPDYIRDPEEIYRKSFDLISSESNLDRFSIPMRKIVIRLIHACGMPDIADNIRYSTDFADSAGSAIRSGAPVFSDVEMVVSGINRKKFHARNEIICKLNDPRIADHAKKIGNTRSAAAVDYWGDLLEGSVVAIGNAPTALFRLLENIEKGGPMPAAILGFPVGFVGAAESKRKLAEGDSKTPFITLLGRRGGSAIASAAVNALFDLQNEV